MTEENIRSDALAAGSGDCSVVPTKENFTNNSGHFSEDRAD
jgi:hypothetical protein